MPAQPNVNELHIDHYLTDLAIVYSQDPKGFVAGQVFPTVPVQFKSDYYPTYPRGYFFRDEFAVRPYGGRPKQAGYKIEKGHYAIEEEALEFKIDDRERSNYDVGSLDPDIGGQRFLTEQAMIHRDRLWAQEYFKTGVWSKNWEGLEKAPSKAEEEEATGKFLQFDQTGSEPIEFFDQRRVDLQALTGRKANILVLGQDTFRVLKNHPAVVERIKYTQRGLVTEDILAALLGFEKVLVPGGVINTAKEGQADKFDFIVGRKSALMVFAPPAPGLNVPSAGYSFAWTGLLPGVDNAFGGVIERGREELAHSDVLQCRTAFTQGVTAPDLGEFFNLCVST